MDIRDELKKIEVFRNCREDSLQAIEVVGTVKKYERGQHVFRDKDEVRTIYVLLSGMVSLYKMNGAGERKVIFVYREGQMLNEVILNDLPASVSCEVLERAEVLAIPKNQLEHLMEQDFTLTKNIINSMSIKIRRMYRQLKNASSSIRLDKKIAAKLWKLGKDYGEPCPEGVRIKMRLSITYLADMLGAKRETVSRQLKVLTQAKLVDMQESHFVIRDMKELQNYFKEEK